MPNLIMTIGIKVELDSETWESISDHDLEALIDAIEDAVEDDIDLVDDTVKHTANKYNVKVITRRVD
jgi:hypothetical protein